MVRALEAVLDRDLTGYEVDQCRWDEEWADATRPPLLQDQRRLVDGLQATDTRADHHAGACETFFVLRFPARILDRLFCRGQSEDDEPVKLPLVLGRQIAVDVEVAVRLVAQRHFAGDPRGQIRRIECLDRTNSRLGRDQAPPVGVDAVTQRRHHSHARNDNSPHRPPFLLQEPAKIRTSRCP